MSHHGLQRALVVALHDAAFVDQLHRDPDGALGPFELSAAERAQLLAVDRRAFGVDRLRARRLLRAIVEELKGSMAIALAEVGRFSFAEEFTASPRFREAVARDRPLVLALADYLADAHRDGVLTGPHLLPVLAIERARAECRRDRTSRGPGLVLPPGVRLVATDASALAALQAVEQHLFELSLLPHIALCSDRAPLPLPPVAPGRPLHLLARAVDGDVSLDEIPEPLHRSLAAIDVASRAAPVHRADVADVLAAVGLRVADPGVLIDDLLRDGCLLDVAS